MGCDIHLYKEKKVGGKWVAADKWEKDSEGYVEVPWKERFTTRNYQLFGMLSKGVREDNDYAFEPRGLPFNLSEEVLKAAQLWDGDGHNHSYLYLHELEDMQVHLENTTVTVKGMKSKDELKSLYTSIESGNTDWTLLFPYCRYTNDKSQEEFEVEVPAAFYVGESLKEIINGFSNVDGENHRIVFWFDN